MAMNEDMEISVSNDESCDPKVVVQNTLGNGESIQPEQLELQAIVPEECFIRCGHLYGVGECVAELKCMVSKYTRQFQFALPLTLEREKELEFELAVDRMQRSAAAANSGSTTQHVVTNPESVTTISATHPSDTSADATDLNATDPERDPETFRKALDTWRAASLRQKAFANKKADLMKLKVKFKPGQLSPALRSALGLESDDLPVHIYRMRELGYPPAWLRRALVQPEARDDTDNEAHGRDGRRKPSKYYNIRKIFDYPGYNVYPPKEVRDEYRRFDAPHLRRSALKWNYVADVNDESSHRAREYRKMCERRGESGKSDSSSDDESDSESIVVDAEKLQPRGVEMENGVLHVVAAKIGTTRRSLEEGELDDSESPDTQLPDLSTKSNETEGQTPSAEVVSRVSSFLIESSTYDLSRLFNPEDVDGDDGDGNKDNAQQRTTEGDADGGERKCVMLPDSVPDLSKFAVSIEPYEAWNVADPTARLEQITGLIKARVKRSRKPRAAHNRRATTENQRVAAERSPSPAVDLSVSSAAASGPAICISNAFPFSQPTGNFNVASYTPFGDQYDYAAGTHPNFHASARFDQRTSSNDRDRQHRRRDRDRRSRSRSRSRTRRHSRSRSPDRRRQHSRSNSPKHHSRR